MTARRCRRRWPRASAGSLGQPAVGAIREPSVSSSVDDPPLPILPRYPLLARLNQPVSSYRPFGPHSPVRILHVIASLDPGGAEGVVLSLAAAATENGADVAIASGGGAWL